MKSQSPFLDAFRMAVHPDFVPPALTGSLGQIPQTVSMTIPADELRKLSATYSCSVKTLRRLLNRGIDITDASAVACQLAGQKSISHPMAKAVLAQLQIIES